MSITYIKASGKDIAELVDSIESAVDGRPNTHVSIACLVVAILAQKPDIAPEKLQDSVKGASEYLATTLFDAGGSIN